MDLNGKGKEGKSPGSFINVLTIASNGLGTQLLKRELDLKKDIRRGQRNAL